MVKKSKKAIEEAHTINETPWQIGQTGIIFKTYIYFTVGSQKVGSCTLALTASICITDYLLKYNDTFFDKLKKGIGIKKIYELEKHFLNLDFSLLEINTSNGFEGEALVIFKNLDTEETLENGYHYEHYLNGSKYIFTPNSEKFQQMNRIANMLASSKSFQMDVIYADSQDVGQRFIFTNNDSNKMAELLSDSINMSK